MRCSVHGRRRCLHVVVPLVVALVVATEARAGGFRVQQGGPSLGNSGAGAPATADDPSTVWFNPAGMSWLDRPQGAVELNFLRTSTRWDDGGSERALGTPLRGGDGFDAGGTFVMPAVHAVVPLGESWRLGLGVNTPFGLVTDYGDSWKGRYHATRTALETVDVGASLAFRISDSLSIGAGIDVQQVSATEEAAIDFGTIAYGVLGPATAEGIGLSPQEDDGRIRISADGIALGWNAGLHWRASEDTRLGLAFRSAVRHHLEGDASFRVPADASPLLASGAFRDTGASTDLTLPEVVSAAIVHRLDPQWSLVGGVDWTRWGRFDELVIDFDNPVQPDAVEQEYWRNVWRVSAGVIWRPDDAWTVRAGVAYDESPVDDRYRTPRLPDADRWWASAGVGVRLGECTRLDVAWVHEFVDRARVRQSSALAGTLVGSVRSSVDYASAQLTIDF